MEGYHKGPSIILFTDEGQRTAICPGFVIRKMVELRWAWKLASSLFWSRIPVSLLLSLTLSSHNQEPAAEAGVLISHCSSP